MKKIPLILVLCILLLNISHAANLNNAIISQINPTPDITRITIAIDTVIINQKKVEEGLVSEIIFQNLPPAGVIGQPELPVFSQKFNASANQISASVRIISEKIIELKYPLSLFQDLAKGDTFGISSPKNFSGKFPEKVVNVFFTGHIGDVPLSSLNYFPLQALSKNRIRIISKAEITVSVNRSDLIKKPASEPLRALFKNSQIGEKPKSLKKSMTENPLFGKKFLNIKISEDGIYRLDYQTLKKFKLHSVNPKSFALYNRGKTVPLYVYGEKDGKFDKNDYIEFLGRRNPNSTTNSSKYDPFTQENVYQLFWNEDQGLRFSLESAEPDYQGDDLIVPVEFDDIYHFEKNENFQRLGYHYHDMLSTVHDQYFFKEQILSGNSADFIFELPPPNQNTTKNIAIEAKLQSISQYTDHTARLLINGQNIGKSSWAWDEPGYIRQNPDFYLPNNFLKTGQNTLTINLEHNTSDQTAAVMLDWVKIHYYRDFMAENNFIEFHKPSDQIDGRYQFNIENFTDIDISVYKNDNVKMLQFQKSYDSENDRYSIRMQDAVNSDCYYVAAAGESISSPDTCYLDTLKNLLDISGCDHLCIVADKFFGSVGELKDFYEEQGIACYPVKLSDIYNQFNDGVASPFAIKKFLKSAKNTWGTFPRWLLLIGDANLTEEDKNLLPTMLYQTYKWGGSVSDYWYSLIDGDDNIPDIAVGRWACGNERELQILLKKRINYTENQVVGPWRQNYLFIAGKEDFFKEQTDYFTETIMEPPTSISRILINPSNLSSRFYGGTDTLVNRVNRGLKVVNFVGHGGGAIWADRSLLRLEDIYKFKNEDKLPFFSSLTCFTADFAAHRSLGESVTELYSGGAIGLLGASGVGWVKNDFLLGIPLFKHLQNKNLSIGEIINLAKIDYYTKINYFGHLKNSMIFQYNLLGDPAVKLTFPDETQDYLSIENKQAQPNSKIDVSGQLPYESGDLQMQIYDSQKYPITPVIPYSFTTSDFSNSIFLPDSSLDYGYINIYGRNRAKTQDFTSALHFRCQKNSYSKITLSPEKINYGDEISMIVEFIDAVDSVRWEIDTTNVYTTINDIGLLEVKAFQDNESPNLSIICQKKSGNIYQSRHSFAARNPNKFYAYRIAWFTEGKKHFGPLLLFDFQQGIDISISALEQGGTSRPSLVVTTNLTGKDTILATLRVFASEGNQYTESEILYQKKQRLIPYKENKIELPLLAGKAQISGTVEITSDKQEKNFYNNFRSFSKKVTHFQGTSATGSSFTGTTNDTLKIDDNFSFYLPSGAISDSCVIAIEPVPLGDLTQPDFFPALTKDSLDIGYRVTFSKDLSLTQAAVVQFQGSSVLQNTDIIRLEPSLKIWTRQNSTQKNQQIFATISEPGYFSLARIEDTEKPVMEINFDGKEIEAQSYVGPFPMISFSFNDDNGIHLTEEGFKIWIDDEAVDFQKLNLPDTLDNTQTTNCSFRSELETGHHYLKVEINDAASNKNETELEFTIFKNLKIMDYGNYPNPFQTRTWFVYETTTNVEDFKINIYTASGRKIRTIDDTNSYSDKEMTESGYHEISWDGKDDYGDNIANGVYYYKMIAKTSSKTVSTKGVIAKVK